MAAQRKCSEHREGCVPLTRLNQKTCSLPCRQRRARRLKKAQKTRVEAMAKARELPEHLKTMSSAANREAPDVGHELLKEEMRPIVKEAITEDVLAGINALVSLTPRMVELIARDMESSDPYLAQKAYTLLARYTLGNASVAPQPAAQAAQPMQVQFLMPRPGDTALEAPAVAVELRTCVECNAEKPATDFVGASPRCQVCHDTLQDAVKARFGE